MSKILFATHSFHKLQSGQMTFSCKYTSYTEVLKTQTKYNLHVEVTSKLTQFTSISLLAATFNITCKADNIPSDIHSKLTQVTTHRLTGTYLNLLSFWLQVWIASGPWAVFHLLWVWGFNTPQVEDNPLLVTENIGLWVDFGTIPHIYVFSEQ